MANDLNYAIVNEGLRLILLDIHSLYILLSISFQTIYNLMSIAYTGLRLFSLLSLVNLLSYRKLYCMYVIMLVNYVKSIQMFLVNLICIDDYYIQNISPLYICVASLF